MVSGATAVVALTLLIGVAASCSGPSTGSAAPAAAPGAPHAPTAPENPPWASLPPGPSVADPAAAGATGRLVVATTDPAALPNTGLRTNISAYSADTLPADTSFQVSATETIGGYDAVFGLFENTVNFPVAFFYVFNNSTDAPVLQGYWSNLTLLTGFSYDFELVAVNATYWELTVNGAEFADNGSLAYFDFGAGSSTWAGGLLFTEIAFYGTVSPVPAVVNVPLALAVRTAGGWYLPESAATAFSGSGGRPWGIEGQEQHPTLAPGELDTGTSIAPVANGTSLWSGGPTAVHVGITLSASSAVATTPFFLSVTVQTPFGSPLPGVSVFVGDSLGGTGLVAPLVTDGTGTAEQALQLPNVSTTSSDLVRAVVTLFGYQGSAGVALQVDPALQVFLTAPGLPGTVAPGAEVTFSVSAMDAQGGTVAGASLVLMTPTVGGDIIPTDGVTGSDGTFPAQLLAPLAPTVMLVVVNVTGGGAWGHATFTVNVATPAPSFWALHGGQVELGAGLGVVALGAILGVWRFRIRRGRKLPASYGIRWGGSSGPTAGGPPTPPTRRPPSGGAP